MSNLEQYSLLAQQQNAMAQRHLGFAVAKTSPKERLNLRKADLEIKIKQLQAELEAVTIATAKLDSSPELDKVLDALSKAGVL